MVLPGLAKQTLTDRPAGRYRKGLWAHCGALSVTHYPRNYQGSTGAEKLLKYNNNPVPCQIHPECQSSHHQ